MPALQTIQGVSYPRSGHKLLVQLLAGYFGTLETGAPMQPPGPVEDVPTHFAVGPFSYCEYYGCCRSRPCTRGAIFRKYHDVGFGPPLEPDPAQRYVIQYRHPVPTIVADFERTPVDLDWAGMSRARARSWQGWIRKWVLGWQGPHVLHVFYDDLVRDTRHTLVSVLAHFGHPARAELIPERLGFLRRNLDDYDVGQILRITRPVREALGMPDVPGA